MKISPRYRVKDWNRLGLTPNSSRLAWKKAILIFDDRIKGRFLRFVDSLQKRDFAGFIVVGLDCMLAETIQAFREGLTDTRRQTKAVFVRFLRQSNGLKAFRKGTRAHDFHHHVRSRIAHHGDTTGGWLINRGSTRPLLKLRQNNAFIVNRDKFHRAILQEYKYYKNLLVSGRGRPEDVANIAAIRQGFINKMKHICNSETPM